MDRPAYQRSSIAYPFGIAGVTESAHHIGEFPLRTTQRRNDEDSTTIVITTAKGDLASVTVLFRRVYISYADRFVVLEPW